MSEQRSGFKVTPIPRPGESELAWHEWLLLFSIIIAAALFCALGGQSLLKARPGSAAIVFATPTLPPVIPTRTPAVTATPTVTPTPQPTVSPTPGIIAIGAFVKVAAAGPQGLSFRREPGLQAERLKYLPEGVVLRVVDGPRDVDGLKWWKLQDRNNLNDIGWAAGDYLVLTTP